MEVSVVWPGMLLVMNVLCFFFFFQAEDGIRDVAVTGVQTCALPIYRTADGFIFIMCNKEKFWPVLCGCLGRPEWAADPRFRTFKDRLKHRDAVNRLLDEALSAKTTQEWLLHFAGSVPAAPVNDFKAAID